MEMAKTQQLTYRVWEKTKIPKGTDDGVSFLKTDGVGAHHLTEPLPCCIMNMCEKPTAELFSSITSPSSSTGAQMRLLHATGEKESSVSLKRVPNTSQKVCAQC